MAGVLLVVEQARTRAMPPDSRWSKTSARLDEISSRIVYYGGVLDALSQHHPEYVALAWGAMKFVLMVSTESARTFWKAAYMKQGIINHGELLHKFAQAFVEIGDALNHATCIALIYDTLNIEIAISQLYLQIMRFLSKAVVWYTRNPVRRMLSAIGSPWELKYKDCLEGIRTWVAKVNGHAVTASWAELRVVHDDLSTQGAKLNNVEIVVSGLQSKFEVKFDKILELLERQLQVNLSSYSQPRPRLLQLTTWVDHRNISSTLQKDMNEMIPGIRDLQMRTILEGLRPELDPDQNLLQMQLVLKRNSNLRDFLQNGDHIRRCIERWFDEQASSLLMVRVAIRFKIMAKTILVDTIRALQSSKWPTFFVLPKATFRTPTDRSILLVTWIKAIIHQAMNRNPDFLTRPSGRLQTVQYCTDHSPEEWIHLLGQLLASLRRSCLVLDTIDLYEQYYNEPDTFQSLIDLLKGLIDSVRTAQGYTKIFILYYGSNPHTGSSQGSQTQELTCSLQYRPVPPKMRTQQAFRTTAQRTRLRRVTRRTS